MTDEVVYDWLLVSSATVRSFFLLSYAVFSTNTFPNYLLYIYIAYRPKTFIFSPSSLNFISFSRSIQLPQLKSGTKTFHLTKKLLLLLSQSIILIEPSRGKLFTSFHKLHNHFEKFSKNFWDIDLFMKHTYMLKRYILLDITFISSKIRCCYKKIFACARRKMRSNFR